jgi:hypothetical protein
LNVRLDNEPPKSWQNHQIAWAFTLFYWLFAISLAIFMPHHPSDYIDPRWLFAILIVAIPLTAIVWLTALVSMYTDPPLSPKEFSKVSAGLTIVYAVLLVFWFFWVPLSRR